MNKEIKKLWVEALRSGKYKQGTGRLSRVDDNGVTRMCCLGVLCDLYTKQTGNGGWIVYDEMIRFISFPSVPVIGESSLLPREVAHWADLDNNRGMKGINLDSMNDGIGQPAHSYAEIAMVIEECF